MSIRLIKQGEGKVLLYTAGFLAQTIQSPVLTKLSEADLQLIEDLMEVCFAKGEQQRTKDIRRLLGLGEQL